MKRVIGYVLFFALVAFSMTTAYRVMILGMMPSPGWQEIALSFPLVFGISCWLTLGALVGFGISYLICLPFQDYKR